MMFLMIFHFRTNAVENESIRKSLPITKEGNERTVDFALNAFEIKTLYLEREPVLGQTRRASSTVSTPSPKKKFRRA